MALVLFDTNILIDHFNYHDVATEVLEAYHDSIISVITWIEVACKFNETKKQDFAALLAICGIRVVHQRRCHVQGG